MLERTWVQRTGSRCVAVMVLTTVLTAITVGGGHALAQTFNSGSTGTDGAFNPTTNTTLTLPPDGVFNFTTVNIPAGITVTFTRNATNTPVTMLATSNVTIAGAINISGSNGGPALSGATVVGSNGGAGGPGGFDGGSGATGLPSASGGNGLGPGGGAGGPFAPSGSPIGGGGGGSFATSGGSGGGGSAAGTTYGAATLLPLIGGSGGGGGGTQSGSNGAGGGGGGGAILIASSGFINLFGSITAKGGNGGVNVFTGLGAGGSGSGGAVRLAANTIGGSGGSISVTGGPTMGSFGGSTNGGAGGAGRIRIEAFTNGATITFSGAGASVGAPGPVTIASGPSLRIASVAGVPAPATPTGSFSVPDVVVPFGTANPMTVALAAANVPLGTTVSVTVSPVTGGSNSAVSSPLAGTLAASTASASVTIPTDRASVISASATFTLASLPGAGPLYADGEKVERVRVAATLGGPSQVTYITTSGREIASTSVERAPTPTE